MELTNEFTVAVPIDDAWGVLTDVERIAPCMPGAKLEEIEGDEYRGVVRVKVGPITAQFKGAARFAELDKDAHKAVLRAEGRDTRGQGNANALITAQLEPVDDGTKVTVSTELHITGRVAQFGRGVMADVSAKLLGQFVDCLHDSVLSGDTGGPNGPAPTPEPAAEPAPSTTDTLTAEATTTTTTDATTSTATATAAEPATVRRVEHPETEPVDLIGTAGAPVAKRVIPVVIGAFVLLWLVRRRRRRS
jgi:carbon monoxide dehydrogenase subunit G